MYKVLDLFSGAGGMSLGFIQTGKYHIAVAVENNPHAQATFIKNHNDTILIEDILEITDYEDFEKKYGKFDVVIGGPPCQGFSNANRQKNHIISQNNSLVKKYVEVIQNLKPIAFVMENVPMLQSGTHRFYISKNDDLNGLEESLCTETLCLHDGVVPEIDIEDFLFNYDIIKQLLIPEQSLNILKLFLKRSYNEKNRNREIEKRGKKCIDIINAISDKDCNISKNYKQFEEKAISNFLGYLKGEIPFNEAENHIASYLKIQQLLASSKELLDNKIIVKSLRLNETGIYAEVQTITVVDYLKKKLGEFYLIEDSILNAAWFGAPQLRERFIALGIHKEIAVKKNIQPELPKAEFSSYRTVWDAIKDLEELEPSYNVKAEAIPLDRKNFVKTALTNDLRISDMLYNHVVTKSNENTLKRFAALKPGQNFHNLDKSLIENTYSKPERTQNSIYLRLDYKKPSGTVTNVRKSMWIHPVINRAISIREAARLQTFPDNFIFEGSKDSQYQQIGNAVPPIMAKAIAKKLVELLEGSGEVISPNKGEIIGV